MKITTNTLLLAGGAFIAYKYFLHGQIFGGSSGGTVTLPPGGSTGNAALDCLSKGGYWGPPGGGAMPSVFAGYQCWPSFEAYRQASMQQ